MLVLTRKHQEKIRIGEHITITVLRTKGKAVRLGIEAPAEVPVIRAELTFAADRLEPPVAGTSVAAAPESAAVVQESVAEIGRAPALPGFTGPTWPGKAESAPVARQRPGGIAPRVSVHRIPREQVAQVFPGLKSGSGAGPLREMLDRRSLTT